MRFPPSLATFRWRTTARKCCALAGGAIWGEPTTRPSGWWNLVVTDSRVVGMMNVHTLNFVPRDEWTNTSVQAAMIPREKILWAAPDESVLGLLERLLAADVNQMPVVSGAQNDGAQIIG